MVWIVGDYCGIACVLLAWLLMAYSQYTLLTIVIIPKLDEQIDLNHNIREYLHIFIFELFSILVLLSHLRTIFTDPGSVPRKSSSPEPGQQINSDGPSYHLAPSQQINLSDSSYHLAPSQQINSDGPSYHLAPSQQINSDGPSYHLAYKCPECYSFKPDRAHHCSVCHRCIRKMDHHCPWVNNCVGERNQKFFVLFTFYVTVLSSHALMLALNYFLDCLWSPDSSCPMMSRGPRQSPQQLIMLIFLIFEALLFALFSAIMFCIQMKAIWSDWTAIENLKKESRNRQSGCANLKDVFGTSAISWLSPLTRAPEKVSPPNRNPIRIIQIAQCDVKDIAENVLI